MKSQHPLPRIVFSILAVLAFLAAAAVAAPGDLDTTFGTGGIVTTSSDLGEGLSVAVQSDGKIVVAGYTWNGSGYDFALVRYLTDGTLDTSFGTGGTVTTPIGSDLSEGLSVVVQSDGKIVVAGNAHNGSNADFAVVRYTASGALDTGFGTGGKVTTNFGGNYNDRACSVVVQGDGKIVVAGVSGADFALARYTSSGVLDSGFGVGGLSVANFGGNETAYSMALQSDGKIVVAGSFHNGSNDDFVVARFMTGGAVDANFGTSGKVITAIGTSNESASSVAVQNDGKIVVAGSSINAGNNFDFALVRYTAGGALDGSFGTGGKVTTPIGGSHDTGHGVALQSDGEIVVAGSSNNGSNDDFALVRYTGSGALDSSFGTGGKVTTPIGNSYDRAHSVTLQSDGNIVVTGGADFDFALVRYQGDTPEIDVRQPAGTSIASGGSRDFGTVNVGNTADLTFTIASTGTANLNLTGTPKVAVSGTDAGLFTVTTQPTSPVAASGTTTFTVRFAPTTTGAKTATLTIANDDSNESTYTIDLTGTGIPAPEIDVQQPAGTSIASGGSKDFGTVNVGSTANLTFTIANTGNGDLNLTGAPKVAVSGTHAILFSVTAQPASPVAVSGTSTFTVRFAPTNIGGKSATLTIANNDSNESPYTIQVSGTGADLAPPNTSITSTHPTSTTSTGATITFTGSDNVTPSGSLTFEGQLDGAAFAPVTSPVVLSGLTDGSHTYQVRARDAAGQVDATPASVTWVVDRTPPDTSITSTHPTPTGRTTANIYFTGSDNVTSLAYMTYQGRLDGAAFATVNNPVSLTGLANGSHTYEVRARDTAGNFDPTPVSVSWTVDTTLPVPGVLDPTFGTGGKVITSVGGSSDFGRSVALQSDGKILVAGESLNGSSYDFSLVRYTVEGELDSGFGTGGKVITPIGSYDDYGHSVAMQSDGKIVVAGYALGGSTFDFALVRYTASGALDTSFGTGGKVITSIGSGDDYGHSVAVQSDGKIFVAGSTIVEYSPTGNRGNFALVRYTASGALDTSFGTGGKVTTPVGASSDFGNSVAVQSDGKILVAGETFVRYSPATGNHYNFALVRYTASGALDSSFGTDGKVTTNFGRDLDHAYGVAVQSDGNIVVAGTAAPPFGTTFDFALARYTTTGGLDPSFGDGGKVTTLIDPNGAIGRSVAVQSDGKIVVAGYSGSGSTSDFALVRYMATGAEDTDFGSGGRATTGIGSGYDTGQSVTVQSDGKIVVAGYSFNGSNYDFALVRYEGSPLALPEIDVQQPAGGSLASGGGKDFGTVNVGSTADLTFTIANTGTADLDLTGTPKVAVSGTDVSLFTMTMQPASPVAASGTTTFTARFAPTSAGSKSATITIASNDSDEGAYAISLTGTGLTAQESWRLFYFGTTGNTGNAAAGFDFDLDGLTNLIEWACLLDPTTSSVLPASVVRNGAVIEFTYTRSVAAVNAGAAFLVQWTDTLTAPVLWSTSGVTEQILSDDGTVQTVKASVPTGSSVGFFVRLKVIAPE